MQKAALTLAIFVLSQAIAFSQILTPHPDAATYISSSDVT